MIKKIILVTLSILAISVLVYAWVENKDPVVEIDSITPRGAGNAINWNALVTIAGSVYDGLAIPGAYGGSGINVAQVSVSDLYGGGGFVQVGNNITTEVQNTTLATWSGFKMGTRYRVKVYAEDNAANTTTVTEDVDITSHVIGIIGGGIVGGM